MKTWKPLFLVCALASTMAGCGASQKDLRAMNDLLERSKTADCDTIHTYLDLLQTKIKDQIK